MPAFAADPDRRPAAFAAHCAASRRERLNFSAEMESQKSPGPLQTLATRVDAGAHDNREGGRECLSLSYRSNSRKAKQGADELKQAATDIQRSANT